MVALALGQMQTPESQASLCVIPELSPDSGLCQAVLPLRSRSPSPYSPASDPCASTEWPPCGDPESVLSSGCRAPDTFPFVALEPCQLLHEQA